MIHRKSNRREFFGRTFGLAAAAGALGVPARMLSQQKVMSGMHSSGLYEDSLIFQRKPFKWPGGKTMAVWIVPNVEIWAFDSAVDAAIAPNGAAGPDVINYATREYGLRVGLWRIADVLDSAGLKATVALNSGVCEVYPKAIEEMKRRQWEFIGHGVTNSVPLSKLNAEQEKTPSRAAFPRLRRRRGRK